MKRKGAGTSSQPSSSSNANDMASRDSISSQLGHSTHHSLYTIAITSLVWSSILISSLIVANRYNSSADCQQSKLLPSKDHHLVIIRSRRLITLLDALCTIGQALTRFCSSSDANVQILSPSSSTLCLVSRIDQHSDVFSS